MPALDTEDTADGQAPASRASTPAQQMRSGFRWLRFDSQLESAYVREQFLDGVVRLRICLVILIAMMLVLFQVDQEAMPEISGRMPSVARFGVMVPTLALAIALTCMPRAEIWYPRIASVLAPAALIAVAWLGLWAWSIGEHRLFTRLVMAVTVVYFIFGLPLRLALAGNAVAIAVYAELARSFALPTPELHQNLAVLVMFSVICAMAAYSLEHARRTAWLEARMLEEFALHDGLTGIFNRRRFDEDLERAWLQSTREGKPLSLLFSDIDHFKKYNDRYGHQAGDVALTSVARVLARQAQRPLDIAARFGGEEFAVLLYDTGSEAAGHVAETILEGVRELGIVHADSPADGRLTISIGIATTVPQPGRSSAGLLQLADQALYAAKDGGRNRARALESEYAHVRTGFFHRKMLGSGQPPRDQ